MVTFGRLRRRTSRTAAAGPCTSTRPGLAQQRKQCLLPATRTLHAQPARLACCGMACLLGSNPSRASTMAMTRSVEVLPSTDSRLSCVSSISSSGSRQAVEMPAARCMGRSGPRPAGAAQSVRGRGRQLGSATSKRPIVNAMGRPFAHLAASILGRRPPPLPSSQLTLAGQQQLQHLPAHHEQHDARASQLQEAEEQDGAAPASPAGRGAQRWVRPRRSGRQQVEGAADELRREGGSHM